MKRYKVVASIALMSIFGGFTASAHSALTSATILKFNPGQGICTAGGTYPNCDFGLSDKAVSWWGLDLYNSGVVDPANKLLMNPGTDGGIVIGAAQSAGQIDEPWVFLGASGNHFTTIPGTVVNDLGLTKELDFSGWTLTFANTVLQLGGTPVYSDSGRATVTCQTSACADGESFVLDYESHIDDSDPLGYGGMLYQLHLEGTISAAPTSATLLPNGTLIGVNAGGNPDATGQCTTGSCRAMEITPGVWVWSSMTPGTDGGIIVGKTQSTGIGIPEIPPPCEIGPASVFSGLNACLSTLPDASANKYGVASCDSNQCGTAMLSHSLIFIYADGSTTISNLGTAEIIEWTVNPDSSYKTVFDSIIPVNDPSGFGGVRVRHLLRGQISVPPGGNPPVVNDISISGDSDTVINWMPDFTDPDAGDTHTCAIQTNAGNGYATVNADCSGGTYISGADFNGLDSFTYSVTDQNGLSGTGTVNVSVTGPEDLCSVIHPISQITSVGGGQSPATNGTLATKFTGRITATAGLTSGGRNTVRICPGTSVDYDTISSFSTKICTVNGAPAASFGTLVVGDVLICSNKPEGGDTDRYTVKQGE